MEDNKNNIENQKSEWDYNSLFQIVDDEKPIEESEVKKSISISDAKAKSDRRNRKKRKKHKGIRTIIWVLVIVVLSVGVSATALMAFTDIAGISFGEAREYEIIIPEGSSTEDIANILADEGVIKYPLFFRIYSKLKKEDGKYQYGYYTVKSTSGYEGIISTLQTIGAVAEEKEVTIPEGSTLRAIMQIFENQGLCTTDEFKTAMNSDYSFSFIKDIPKESVYYLLEGYLYADTYKFAYVKDDGVENAKRAISRMLETTKERIFTDENIAKAEKLGYSMHEILTMASIVQLEAGGTPSEMSSVAQVFYNRLNWDDLKLLGSTPTSNYYSERYDTNKYEGLPPGPLNSPSINAIKACLSPNSEMKSTYFVTDKTGKFYYTNSLSEHNAIISQLKSRGLWEY